MKNDELDHDVVRYLIDPAAPPADEVVRLEKVFGKLRHEPRPLVLPERRTASAHRGLRWALAAALAAGFLLAGFAKWRLFWPEGRAWAVEEAAGRSRLAEGGELSVGDEEAALVRVARIGRMTVGPDSRLRLLSTSTVRHRLALDEGSVAVSVWSPPMRLGIETPAGRVFDMGCAFRLDVRDATATVEVTSGWVQLENRRGEVLVPEGAVSQMRSDRRPAVPLFIDAAPRFQQAVRSFEATAGREDLSVILGGARQKDVLTLLLLAERGNGGREELLSRAAELLPPPSSETYRRALAGDRHAIWTWVDALDLPRPKSWLQNWRDGFRRVTPPSREPGLALRS